MRIPEKKDAIIIRGVVIPCGIADKTGDVPVFKEDIKKIFTNYLDHQADIQHSFVKNFGVYQLENTLTETETTINGQKVPPNSWIASSMVVSPEIQEMITNKQLTGYSLGAIGDKGLHNTNDFLNKSLRYEDLTSGEELNPLFISLVDKAANGYTWEVYTYNSFLAKSENFNKGDDTLVEEKVPHEDEKISLSTLERIGTIFNKNFMKKSEDGEEKEEENPEEQKMEKEEEDMEEITLAQVMEAINDIPNQVISAMESFAKQQEEKPQDNDEEKLEKSEEDPQDNEEEKLEKSEKEKEAPVEKEDETLTKSLNGEGMQERFTSRTENIGSSNKQYTDQFLDSETRDRFGRNKKFI